VSPSAGSAVAVGVFDGVHLGHAAIFERARALRPEGGRAIVLSFDPHPDLVLSKNFHPVAPLTPLAEKRARLLALVNMAMADGFVAGMETKYDFNFWRPVTAIRAGDTDGNDETIADPNWISLLNSPAIPDYPSTHSILGGAASEVLLRFFDDDVAFTTTSGVPFAGITRSFDSFSDAARENGNSRIYAGIHFRSAVEKGIKQGNRIGRFVFNHSLRPVDDDENPDRKSRERGLAVRRLHDRPAGGIDGCRRRAPSRPTHAEALNRRHRAGDEDRARRVARD